MIKWKINIYQKMLFSEILCAEKSVNILDVEVLGGYNILNYGMRRFLFQSILKLQRINFSYIFGNEPSLKTQKSHKIQKLLNLARSPLLSEKHEKYL